MWVGRPQTAFDSLARALALLSVSLSDQTMARGGSGRSIALRRALCRFRAAARVAGVHPLLLGADVLRQHQARRRGCADCQRQGGGWGDTARHLDHHVVALVVIVVGVAFVRRGRGEQDTELEPGCGCTPAQEARFFRRYSLPIEIAWVEAAFVPSPRSKFRSVSCERGRLRRRG